MYPMDPQVYQVQQLRIHQQQIIMEPIPLPLKQMKEQEIAQIKENTFLFIRLVN